MRSYTKNGASNSRPDSRSTSCLHIVRNSIRSKEFGNSHVASVYTMFSSRISKRLLIVWRNNLSSGKIRMTPSENFVHWHSIYAITYVAVFSQMVCIGGDCELLKRYRSMSHIAGLHPVTNGLAGPSFRVSFKMLGQNLCMGSEQLRPGDAGMSP